MHIQLSGGSDSCDVIAQIRPYRGREHDLDPQLRESRRILLFVPLRDRLLTPDVVAFMLWLVIKGAKPPAIDAAT